MSHTLKEKKRKLGTLTAAQLSELELRRVEPEPEIEYIRQQNRQRKHLFIPPALENGLTHVTSAAGT